MPLTKRITSAPAPTPLLVVLASLSLAATTTVHGKQADHFTAVGSSNFRQNLAYLRLNRG